MQKYTAYAKAFEAKNTMVLTLDNVEDLGPLLKYESRAIRNEGRHIGQRKLLLTEIQFLATHCRGLVVYMGYAPCEKFSILAELFPAAKFILVDPHFPIYTTLRDQIYDKEFDSDPHRIYLAKNSAAVDKESYKHATDINKRKMNAHISLRKSFRLDGSQIDVTNQNTDFNDITLTIMEEIMNSPARSFIVQDLMTIELAELLRDSATMYKTKSGKKIDICLISDIRTNLEGASPTDVDILFNDALQHVVCDILDAHSGMLKFHTPYRAPGQDVAVKNIKQKFILDIFARYKRQFQVDIVEEYLCGKYPGFEGIIYLQAWAPGASSEARLVFTKRRLVNYNSAAWEDAFFSFKILRICAKVDVFPPMKGRLDQCVDCTLERMIYIQYMSRAKTRDEVMEYYHKNTEKCQREFVRLFSMIANARVRSPHDGAVV